MQIIKTTHGPHTGWHRTIFVYENRVWNLLTIDDEHPRSLLSPDDESKRKPWPHYRIVAVPGILTPETSVSIISAVLTAFEDGVNAGKDEAKSEIRRTLGL